MHSIGKSMELETERENKMLLKNLRKNRIWHDGFPEHCLCFYPSGKETSPMRALLPWEMSPMSSFHTFPSPGISTQGMTATVLLFGISSPSTFYPLN